jgi:hypothetical protein
MVRDRHRTWYCPNGHPRVFTADSAEEKLKRAETRETALRDQLEAAAREAEQVRGVLLRDRQRFANGVCPCCNRSFENVRRHMQTKHPDYDTTKVHQRTPARFACACGRDFASLQGLHIHQTRSRSREWYKPSAYVWQSHLTKV